MSEQEKAIWNAAYGAFIAVEVSYRSTTGWDRAMEGTSAEPACDVADHAVRELRRWRKQEEPKCGLSIK